jgi:phosphate:Na+ symporter
MGANVGTTLGNGLIALPLGPLGLLFGGIFATIYCFAKSDRLRNISLAAMGFSLIFYGLNLMTGGLKPLRKMPEVLEVIQSLDASTFGGVIACMLLAALITALIHSSSATIGIVMGLGAAGVLSWETAIAFAVGADLGTTVTSWIASLNLSKNAKRAAYAHIGFNFIGVAVMLALFFPAMWAMKMALAAWGVDPGAAVLVDGEETFPGVPIAVGVFSIAFNIFNLLIMFPFISTFERVLSRVGHSTEDDIEDFSIPRFMDKKLVADFNAALPGVQKEAERHLQAGALFLDIARNKPGAPKDPDEHRAATDILSREIRAFQAQLFQDGLSRDQLDLVASLIEEVDFTSALSDALYQIARRVKREPFSDAARLVLDQGLERLDQSLTRILIDPALQPRLPAGHRVAPDFDSLRWQALQNRDVAAGEKGALLALLGSVERAEGLVDRIVTERASVDRNMIGINTAGMTGDKRPEAPLDGDMVPAE